MKVLFERTDRSTHRCTIEGLPMGTYTMQLMFDGAEYPFERHCRYMRYRGADSPYTFSNMVFAETPPGRRLGPWPGWRGIPEMPDVTLKTDGESMPISFQFWGDELTCRHVRGVVDIEIDGAQECTIVASDARLVPVEAELFPSAGLHAEPISVVLRAELSGKFPRLLLTDAELPDMRKRAETTHRGIWTRIQELVESWDLHPARTPESKTVEGPERLFGEDRTVIAAFRALIEPAPDNIALAREAFLRYIEQTEEEDFEPLKIDTQSGETLFTLCVAYDWLYIHLTPLERDRATRRLWEVADICWGHLGYDRHDYAQAHFLGCGLGLLAVSFLFWESHPRAREWVSYLRGTLQRVIDMLPDDGFYPHGINLWIYEYGFLLRWMELFRVCTGEGLWLANDHWRNASLFRACATSPDGLYGVTMGDPQYRVGGDSWCHYLIAARTGSEQAQWLAERLADGPHAGVDFRHVPPRRRVYEFLYYDPAVASSPTKGTAYEFQDGGQVFVRGRDDEDPESLFTFRSGPPIGQQRRKAGEPGAYGHSDPANGSFLIWRKNTFLASGPGPTYRRDTGLHNTITIDGQGQVGDSTVWLPDFFPPDVIAPRPEMRTDRSTTLLFADLGRSYLPHLGVELCTRSMLVNCDVAIVGVDTVACSKPRSIDWNLHTWQFLDEIDLHILLPEAYSRTTGPSDFIPAYPHDGTRDTFLRLSVRRQRVRWVWCIGMTKDCRPELVLEEEGLAIKGLPVGEVRFDGKWLIPEGFDEAES